MDNDRKPTAEELALAEDILARHGIACIPADLAPLLQRIRETPALATVADYEAIAFAYWAGPVSDYWQRDGRGSVIPMAAGDRDRLG